MKELKAKYGDKSLGEVTVDQCIGGARGVKCMLWETSLLDTQEGIRFRGHTIPDLQKLLPTYKGPAGEGEPLPEALIWCERASRALGPRDRGAARARAAVHLCRALRRARRDVVTRGRRALPPSPSPSPRTPQAAAHERDPDQGAV